MSNLARSHDFQRARRLGWLFAAAFAIRLLALFVIAPHQAAEGSTAWDFGHEAACLGESIYLGNGLADPWAHGTGPSGWLTPPYPALIASLMALFGGVTSEMAFVLFTLQALASAAVCVLLVRLGENLGTAKAGWWGALFFALYPPAIWNAIHVVWDTTFVAAGTMACLTMLTRPVPLTVRRVVLIGLAWGALAFLNPAPLALLPAVLAYLWISMETRRAALRAAAILCACIALVCAPWMARNWRVLGTPGLRPNFGVELRLGNNPLSNGHPQPFLLHPSHVPEELALYRELGEVGYAADSSARAWAWIRAEPAAFAWLTLKRIQFFWIGDFPFADARRSGGSGAGLDPNAWAKFLSFAALGLLGILGAWRWRGGHRERILLCGVLACFGLAYYVTHVSERYRFPIDPLLALLAASCILGWTSQRSRAASAP